MILEVAILPIKEGQSLAYEKAFKKAEKIIQSINGYINHELRKCVEKEDQYILLVTWESIESHEIGFRKSVAYEDWKNLLHHFYDPFPVVEHYKPIT